ncbi:MAG: hypothetical protein JNJ41_02410 [Bacteroidia bacterium]|nr:hypothetical protein [Bacteroidia bacterium]
MNINDLQYNVSRAINVASNINIYKEAVSANSKQSEIFIEEFERKYIDFKFNQNVIDPYDSINVYFKEALPYELIAWIEIKMSKLENVLFVNNVVSDLSFEVSEDQKHWATKQIFEKYLEVISAISIQNNYVILDANSAKQPVVISSELLNKRYKKLLPISNYNIFFDNIFH